MALLLALALLGTPVTGPGAPKEGPKPSELAKLYFIAGDLLRAHDALEHARAADPKAEPMLKWLADYQYLVVKADRMNAAEAKRLITLDREISPQAMGKMTRPVHEHFVALPLLKAKARLDANLPHEALPFAKAAFEADPQDPDAWATLSKLGVDAGTPPDAGR